MNDFLSQLDQNFTHALGMTIVHSIWQITVISIILGLLLYFFKHKSSIFRYNSGLVSMLLVCIWSVVTFYRNLQVLNHIELDNTLNKALRYSETQVVSNFNIKDFLAGFSGIVSNNYLDLSKHINLIIFIWFIGVVLFFIRFTGGFFYSRRISIESRGQVPSQLLANLYQLARKFGIRQRIQLYSSVKVSVPILIGFLKPVILIPTSLLSGIPANQLETILAHELAHIKRYDYLVNLFQSFLEIIFFYHPGFWWISGAIKREREHCCDDLVVQVHGEQITYIKALSNIEQINNLKSNIMVALSNNKEHLLARIKRLVTGKTASRVTPVLLLTLTILLLASFMLIPLGPKEDFYIGNLNDPDISSHNLSAVKSAINESAIQGLQAVVIDTIKTEKSDSKLEKETEEDVDFDMDFDFDMEEIAVSIQEAMEEIDFEKIHEDLLEVHEEILEDLSETLENLHIEVHFPDSIDWILAKEDFEIAMDEFDEFNNEDFRLQMDEVRKQMKESMKQFREEMKNAMEEFHMEMEKRQLDSLERGTPKF